MKQRDLILAIIACSSDETDFGRTSLQKVAYLYSVTRGVSLGHRAYYYGPFSAVVERDAEALVLSGLVEEQSESLGFLNAAGRPATKYLYAMTDAGNERLALLKQAYGPEVDEIEKFVQLLRSNFGSLNQDLLSTAAKTLYIAREQEEAVSPEKVKELAKDFGWTLNPQKINKGIQALLGLRLVEEHPAS